MNEFITGFASMGFLVAAGFFFRFWRESRDRLFAFFAAAFFLMTVNHPVSMFLENGNNMNVLPYVIRLLSYAIILVGIIDKNLRRN